MRPYGSDRLQVADDGTVVLTCRVAKNGWSGRIAATSTSPVHPGTAVIWGEDGCFEVIDVAILEAGIRYTLAPWGDEHAMRHTEPYDAPSERARLADRQDILRRTRHRRSATLLAVFTGHLPAAVQQHFAHEFGVQAPRMTLISTIPEYLGVAWLAQIMATAKLAGAPPPPIWLVLAGGYMALDAAIRAGVAWLESRPVGSVAGLLAWGAWRAIHPPARALPPALESSRSMRLPERSWTSGEEAEHALAIWGPLLTLLDVQDQRRLADRHAFDWRRGARSTAAFILLFALFGVMSGIHTLVAGSRVSAWLSLATASALAVEQVVRLARLSRSPAPSVLRFLIRPLVKKLL